MSEQNSTSILDNICPVKDETNKCPNFNSIQLGFIKDEIPIYQNNNDKNKSYHIEVNDMNKGNNIVLESFDVDAVLEIKTEKDVGYTGTQNSILIVEDSFLVKAEIDIKKEISICLNNDNGNETYMENITVKNDTSNNTTIDSLNSCAGIKSEDDCKNTNMQNFIFVIEDDGYSVKVENDSFPNTNTSLLCSTHEENTSIQNNEGNYPSYINKSKTNCDKNRYKCDICQKSFSKTSHLKDHMLTHTGEKPHVCGICQKSFSLNGHLKRHMYTHIDEKPYKCHVCQKSYSVKQNLKCHMLNHTGEKPHQCHVCQKSYSIKQSLKYHMLNHTGEKPHQCNICQKSFSMKPSLKYHMVTHTGEKLHVCNICDKSFSFNNNLKRHMLIHTGV